MPSEHDQSASTRCRACIGGGGAAVLLALLSWSTWGPVSIATLCLAWVAAVAAPVAGLIARARAETLTNGRVMLAAVWLSALLLVTALVALRGETHRSHSHQDDVLLFDPVLGWGPELPAELRARGVRADAVVGQRFEAIEGAGDGPVLLLGDSVVYGWGVHDEAAIGAALRREMKVVGVLNGAISGHSIEQYLLYLQQIIQRVRPSVVVVGLYAGNDYEATGLDNWSGHSKPLFVQQGEGIALHRERIGRLNCVDALASSLLFRLLWRWKEVAELLLRTLCNGQSLEEPEHGQVVGALLDRIVGLTDLFGARVLFALLPDRNDLTNPWYVQNLSKRPALRALLEARPHPWFDFGDELVRSKAVIDEVFLPGDAAHYTAHGHTLLAKSLARELSTCFGLR